MKVLLVGALLVVAACGPKPQKQCASAGFCVTGEICDFDRKLGCQVCTCDPWDDAGQQQGRTTDTGPAGPANAPGPPIPVH